MGSDHWSPLAIWLNTIATIMGALSGWIALGVVLYLEVLK